MPLLRMFHRQTDVATVQTWQTSRQSSWADWWSLSPPPPCPAGTRQVWSSAGLGQFWWRPAAGAPQHCCPGSSARRSIRCQAAAEWWGSSSGCPGPPHSAGCRGSGGGLSQFTLSQPNFVTSERPASCEAFFLTHFVTRCWMNDMWFSHSLLFTRWSLIINFCFGTWAHHQGCVMPLGWVTGQTGLRNKWLLIKCGDGGQRQTWCRWKFSFFFLLVIYGAAVVLKRQTQQEVSQSHRFVCK